MEEERFIETDGIWHDEDDPPPKTGYSELQWYILNRWAEWGMMYARTLGLL